MQIGRLGSISATAYQDVLTGSTFAGTDTVLNTGGVMERGTQIQPGTKTGAVECQTCKERKYLDGSDENVSFKSAAHIAPEAAMGAVRAHEGEHVSNAYTKAAQDGAQVVNASVSIHTARCPECGRTYVSGGTTRTTIRYNENNPYGRNQKSIDKANLLGSKMDFSI